MAEGPARRRWLIGLGGLSGRTLLILAALALVVASADRSHVHGDWSADHRYTLSPTLVHILADQHEPVELVGLWNDQWTDATVTDACAAGLVLMARENPRMITYRHIDPQLHRPLLEEFKKRYHEDSAPAIYVVRSTGPARAPVKIPLSYSSRLFLQRDVGAALLTLADPHPPTAVLLTGHGELRPGGGDDNGADLLIHALSLYGLHVSTIELARGDHIPGDALLVIAGPTSAYGPADISAVNQHLVDGGAALILGDDRMPADLRTLLRRRGVLWGMPGTKPAGMQLAAFLTSTDDVDKPVPIISSMSHHAAGAAVAFPHPYLLIDSASVNPLPLPSAVLAARGQSLISPFSVPIFVLDPAQAPAAEAGSLREAFDQLGVPAFTADWLLDTTPDCWLKANNAVFREPNPKTLRDFPIAWAINSHPAQNSVRAGASSRLAVWGSRFAASNGFLSQSTYANQDFLGALGRWLSGREPASGIPPAENVAYRIDISENAFTWLMGGLVVFMPCLFIGLAIIAWWERR